MKHLIDVVLLDSYPYNSGYGNFLVDVHNLLYNDLNLKLMTPMQWLIFSIWFLVSPFRGFQSLQHLSLTIKHKAAKKNFRLESDMENVTSD